MQVVKQFAHRARPLHSVAGVAEQLQVRAVVRTPLRLGNDMVNFKVALVKWALASGAFASLPSVKFGNELAQRFFVVSPFKPLALAVALSYRRAAVFAVYPQPVLFAQVRREFAERLARVAVGAKLGVGHIIPKGVLHIPPVIGNAARDYGTSGV